MKHGMAFLGRTVLLLCLVLSFFAVRAAGPALAADTIKIGAIPSLTGWASFLGTSQKETLDVTRNMINASGGVMGKQIEIIYEDDQSNPTNSVVAATKLIRDKKVVALIAPPHTSGCMAIIPICEQEKVPTLIPTPATASLNKWIFHVLIDDTRHGPGMVKWMASNLGAKKIAILTGDESGFLAGVKAIEDNTTQLGVTIVSKEQYKMQDTNMVPQLTRIKGSKPDAILFYGIASGATVCARNYVQLGLTIPVVCSWGVASTEFAKLTGATVLKDKPWIVFGLQFMYGDKLPASHAYRKVYDPFIKAYKETWHHDAQPYGANAHDALVAVAEAIKMAKSDQRPAIRDAMEKIKFEGLEGPFACSPTNHYAMSVEAVLPQLIKTGEFLPYKK